MQIKDIGLWIKEERQKNKMTQQEVADELFITPQAVSKWERGECLPDITLLPTIAELFSVDIKDVLLENEKQARDKTIEEVVSEMGALVSEELYEQLLFSIQSSKSVKEFTLTYQIFVLLLPEQRKEIIKEIVKKEDYPILIGELITYFTSKEKSLLVKLIMKNNDLHLLEDIIPFLDNQIKTELLRNLLHTFEMETIENILPFLTVEQKDIIIEACSKDSRYVVLLENTYPFLNRQQQHETDVLFAKWEELL